MSILPHLATLILSMEYSIIVPAYNEEQSIENALNRIAEVFDTLQKPYEILVIDDGSTDATATLTSNLVSKYPTTKLLRHEINKGKGEAVKTGVSAAKGVYTVFLDADLATEPSTFLSFIPALKDHPIVIGSRKIRDARIAKPQPWYRHVFGNTFNAIIRHTLDLEYTDTQCGFKAFQTPVAKELFQNLETTGWTFDVEILLKAKQKQYSVKELPVTWKNGSMSRVKLSEAPQILKEILALKKRYQSTNK
ncbi:MAG: glycosyltransferase family 2 protein [Candidatus Nomurabacteria bacterium]|nr:MAG: glycosyltransferase family 2 protein [Candidatus Nomurabacteria bacterium]